MEIWRKFNSGRECRIQIRRKVNLSNNSVEEDDEIVEFESYKILRIYMLGVTMTRVRKDSAELV